ncbi:MAG: amidohydrolase family protein, partial [Armatimonadota bacterium]|nr:amidohydrolase family protein [Armatimonadota bacterium]
MLRITGGTIVTPEAMIRGDVLTDGAQIAAIGRVDAAGATPLPADGCLVLPGIIDCHVHYLLTSGAYTTRDDFASASRAAAAGGVTTAIDYVTQHKGESFQAAIAGRRAEAEGQVYIDYGLHLIVTDVGQGQLDEVAAVVAGGVPSAKVYTTYKASGFYLDDWSWYRLLQRAGAAGLLVTVHAENDDLLEGRKAELVRAGATALRYHAEARPALAEVEAVHRGLLLARSAGAPVYFVHLSSPASVHAIREARRAGQRAFAETCTHYLTLTDEVYAGPHPERYLMTPPLRGAAEQQELWRALAAGDIDCVGSDHCGYSLDQRLGLDFTRVSPGIPGTELLLPLLYSEGVARGRIAPSQLVRVIADAPARLFGLYPRKGTIVPGA